MIINKYQEALNNVKRVYVASEHYDEEDINLLQRLIDLQENKKEITELQLKKAYESTYKWWLYFES